MHTTYCVWICVDWSHGTFSAQILSKWLKMAGMREESQLLFCLPLRFSCHSHEIRCPRNWLSKKIHEIFKKIQIGHNLICKLWDAFMQLDGFTGTASDSSIRWNLFALNVLESISNDSSQIFQKYLPHRLLCARFYQNNTIMQGQLNRFNFE